MKLVAESRPSYLFRWTVWASSAVLVLIAKRILKNQSKSWS